MCTGQRNRVTFQGLIPHENYFVDVFGIHMKIFDFIFKLGTLKVNFDRSHPIELNSDRIEIGKINKFNRKLVYSYRNVCRFLKMIHTN